MKLSINRSDLLSALSHVQSVVERRTISPILANVLLVAKGDTLALTTTDLDISVEETIKAQVHEEGATTVPALTFYEIIRKLPDGAEVELKHNQENHQITLKCGKIRFNLPTLPAEEFSASTVSNLPHSFTLTGEECRYLLNQTRFAMSADEARYYLNGIFLHVHRKDDGQDAGNVLRAVATDGHRLALAEVPAPEGVEGMPSVIIPRKTVLELSRLLDGVVEDVQIFLSLTQILFSIGSAHLQSRLIDGTFPAYEDVIPRGNEGLAVVGKNNLKQAVDRVALLSQEKTRGIKVTFSKGQLEISASSPDAGSAVEDLEVEYAGDRVDVGFNARYLLDILNQIDCSQVRWAIGDASAPVILQGDTEPDALFVLMPMRI